MLCFGGKLSLYINGVDETDPSKELALGHSKQIGEQATLYRGELFDRGLSSERIGASIRLGYVIHHCIRRSLDITEKRREFPFMDHPNHGTAEVATLGYLDTVVDRIFANSK